MQVEVRYFASLVERAGCRRETVEVEADQDVARLWRDLVQRHAPLGEIGFRPLVVCDLSWSDWSRRLEGVREVAFLPPVSGG